MRQLKFFILLVFAVCAAPLAAQTYDFSGRYEGTADLAGVGKIPIKAEIRTSDGKYSGVVNTPLGDAEILEGGFKEGVFTIKIDAGGEDVFFSGKTDGGRFAGTVAGDNYKGTFELRRTGDAAPVRPIALRQSRENWREDLRFFARELAARHKNAFHRISRADYERMVAALDARIPALSDEEIYLGMARIAAQIGDGHTMLHWQGTSPRVPLRLFWFGRELRVVEAAKEFSHLAGARLTKIGGVPIERIDERAREYISPGESEQFVQTASAYLLTFPVFLKQIGLTNELDRAAFELVDRKGKKQKIDLRAVPRAAAIEWVAPYKQAPLYLQQKDKPFFFEYLKDAKTVYVAFRWYPRRPEFARFSRELFDFIDRSDVARIVFDLRHNSGGDFTRGRDYFIKPLKERAKFAERGRLFVITGRETYSAGMANAADFRNELKAVLIGEPTGARPVGYQENRTFELPHSRLPVSVSVEHYKFSDRDTPGLTPDRRIDPDWKSYLEGRDPALEWVVHSRFQIPDSRF